MKLSFMVKNAHLLNGHMLYVHIGIASMRQFQYVPTTHITEIKETYFEIYTKQVPCPLTFSLVRQNAFLAFEGNNYKAQSTKTNQIL